MADGSKPRDVKVPPSNLDAEGAVIAACLLDPRECVDELRQVLHPHHFYADANRFIYQAILDLDAEGKPVDILTVKTLLSDRQQLQKVGGAPYLASLSDAQPAIAHVLDHAKLIIEKARVRQVISVSQRFATEGYEDVGDPQQWAQNCAQVLADVAASGEERDPPEDLAAIIPAEVKAIRERAARNVEIVGIDTKLAMLNKLTGGLETGLMHVVGGRPGMGKTSVALGLGLNAAEQRIGVMVCSAEMNKKQLTHKLIAADARIDHSRVRSGVMHREEWPAFADSAKHLATLPIILFHQPGMTIPAMRSAVRKGQRQLAASGVKLGLVIADYLQIFSGRDLIGRGEGREREVSEISKRLLWMAGEFDVAMLALSQLNRSVEDRSNKSKRPTMSDLRESGQIEQDAATIMLLYRDEYYHKDSPDKGTLEANIAKNRFGTTGRAYLKFTAEYGRIDNLAADYEYGGDEDQGG